MEKQRHGGDEKNRREEAALPCGGRMDSSFDQNSDGLNKEVKRRLAESCACRDGDGKVVNESGDEERRERCHTEAEPAQRPESTAEGKGGEGSIPATPEIRERRGCERPRH